MSWIEHHENSERLASQAQVAAQEGRRDEARALYARAADAEESAIADLDRSKARTLGISSVSAASLHYKANQFARAEAVASRYLGFEGLPAFAKDQLRLLLQSIWIEQVRDNVGARFAPGQVLISVQGGEIVPGGAPLDLIAGTVKTVKSLIYRTAEFMSGLEHRGRGAPSREIRESYRPWLFQTAPGSYQFAVAIRNEYQAKSVRHELRSPREVTDCFLRILRVGTEDSKESFAKVVHLPDYRRTFLELTCDLAPDGKTCDRLDIRSPAESQAVSLDLNVRRKLEHITGRVGQAKKTSAARREPLHGILRALHLDQNWIELTVGNKHLRITSVRRKAIEVLGPLVNRPVIVYVSVVGEKRKFLGIESDSQALGNHERGFAI